MTSLMNGPGKLESCIYTNKSIKRATMGRTCLLEWWQGRDTGGVTGLA